MKIEVIGFFTKSTPSTNLGNRIKRKKADWLTIISFSHMMKDNPHKKLGLKNLLSSRDKETKMFVQYICLERKKNPFIAIDIDCKFL